MRSGERMPLHRNYVVMRDRRGLSEPHCIYCANAVLLLAQCMPVTNVWDLPRMAGSW